MSRCDTHKYYNVTRALIPEILSSIKDTFIDYDRGCKHHSKVVPTEMYTDMKFTDNYYLSKLLARYKVYIAYKTTFIPTLDDEGVGLAGWCLAYQGRDLSPIIQHIEILPNYRGNNYGYRIYKYVRDMCYIGECRFQLIRNRKNIKSYITYLQTK